MRLTPVLGGCGLPPAAYCARADVVRPCIGEPRGEERVGEDRVGETPAPEDLLTTEDREGEERPDGEARMPPRSLAIEPVDDLAGVLAATTGACRLLGEGPLLMLLVGVPRPPPAPVPVPVLREEPYAAAVWEPSMCTGV